MSLDWQKLTSIFMPTAMKELERLKESCKLDFVHYTSAENFLNIFNCSAPAIWMRNARCMNDVSEIEHGLSRISLALKNDNRLERLKKALNSCHQQLGENSIAYFESHLNGFWNDTYITCVSVHDADKENDTGRLSMWRAYGQGSIGVAIVLDKSPFFSNTNYFEAFSSPVAYIDDQVLGDDIDTIISGIEDNQEWLSSLPVKYLYELVFNMLKFGIICLKHKGFEEEKEWRIIYTPTTRVGNSPLEDVTVTVSGVPQRVYKIALKDYTSEQGAFDISPNSLVKRVIIGPSNYPEVIKDAVVDTLNKAGVIEAEKRVVISDIPLRTLL